MDDVAFGSNSTPDPTRFIPDFLRNRQSAERTFLLKSFTRAFVS
jgi:hypothetical protein